MSSYNNIESLDRRIRLWLLLNHGIEPDFTKDIILGRTDDKTTVTVVWNLEVPQPTEEQLMSFDNLTELEKNITKNNYPIIRDRLIQTEPEFALVYDVYQPIFSIY